MTSSAEQRRIFFVGLNTGYTIDSLPDERCIGFYSRRASPRLYCAIVGNVVIPGGHGSNPSTPILSNAPVWEELATAISAQGTRPGIQLTTAWAGYVGSRNFRNRNANEVIAEARSRVGDMSPSETKNVLAALDTATTLAINAGYRHIQLHAAHGYLFSLLIDPQINPRAHEVQEHVALWADRVNTAGLESSLRISMRSGAAELDTDARQSWIDQLAALPVGYLDISSGFYNIDKKLIYPGRPDVLAERRRDTITLAQRHRERAFIYSGRALSLPANLLPANLHVGLCRDLIANPDYLEDPSWGCENAGHCHYFSRGEHHVTCSRW